MLISGGLPQVLADKGVTHMKIILWMLFLSLLVPNISWPQEQQKQGLKEIRMSEGNGPVSPTYQRKEEYSLSNKEAYLIRTGGENVAGTGKYVASLPADDYTRLEQKVYGTDLEKAKDVKKQKIVVGGGYIVLELIFENGKTYRFASTGASYMPPDAIEILTEVKNIIGKAQWKKIE
jgi:hypothetical protein